MTPTPPTLNMNWVTPELAVGGHFPLEAAEHLARQLGIRHVVDVRVELRDDEHVLREHGITLLHLPTVDMRAISQPMLREGVAWVRERLERGEKVFIHCQYGMGRSVLLVLCVLTAGGLSPLEALTLTRSKRRQMFPNKEQLEAFREFALEWKQTHAAPWTVPELEELLLSAHHSGWLPLSDV
jgi:protein-tyrosine phosphatase